MHDAQTPQEALDIAAATTRQAKDATALPMWGPIAAGFMTALTVFLLSTAIDHSDDPLRASIFGIPGIASGFVYYKLLQWLRRTRRARGIMPLPQPSWKFYLVLILSIALMPPHGLESSRWDLWLQILSSAIMGGWIWFDQARPRLTPWKARWKN
ncbi:hypothetical protein [Nocardia arthritidis]|uniref:hypothetical protein n=1 Tax=Nocardia arthritidis TaxID=228602 RepID=UPI00142DBB92|nr:hypothetical protein [Nocardia arthritidis]